MYLTLPQQGIGRNFLAECPYEHSSDDDFPHISGSNTPLLLPCNDLYVFIYTRPAQKVSDFTFSLKNQ
jgi:hypothetical protein